MTFKGFKAKSFENCSLLFLDTSQSRVFPGLLEWKNTSVGSYLLCYPQQLCFLWEKFFRKAPKAQVLSHFQGTAWVLVLHRQKEQPWAKPLGSLWRHQRTSMMTLRSCRTDCECGPCSACVCEMPFKISPAAMSHLCLPAATAQMPQAPSLQTAVSGESSNRSCFKSGLGNGFISLSASMVSHSGWVALNSH